MSLYGSSSSDYVTAKQSAGIVRKKKAKKKLRSSNIEGQYRRSHSRTPVVKPFLTAERRRRRAQTDGGSHMFLSVLLRFPSARRCHHLFSLPNPFPTVEQGHQSFLPLSARHLALPSMVDDNNRNRDVGKETDDFRLITARRRDSHLIRSPRSSTSSPSNDDDDAVGARNPCAVHRTRT